MLICNKGNRPSVWESCIPPLQGHPVFLSSLIIREDEELAIICMTLLAQENQSELTREAVELAEQTVCSKKNRYTQPHRPYCVPKITK